MANMKITVEIRDLPELKAWGTRLKKVMRRNAWINGQKAGKERKRGWAN
ncbi:MAG: hypothetical protein K2L07_15820 [Lachnospiraceae bacterium]|nr:hypothetical protein [Lachnospiraceae bacterium]